MVNHKTIDASIVKTLLEYEKNSGLIRWINTVSSRAKAGAVAGHIENNGYRSIRIMGVSYLAHRLVFVLTTGSMPNGFVDHIDGNRDNNKFDNLRVVDRKTNCQNLHGPLKNNKFSGLLGVSQHNRKWKAQIYFDGSKKYLGSYESPELAHAAYLRAKRAVHEGCTI